MTTRKKQYLASTRHQEKTEIANEIIDIISNREGHFLRKIEDEKEMKLMEINSDTDTWLIVDDNTVLQKVKQALRENVNRYQGGGKDLTPMAIDTSASSNTMSGPSTALHVGSGEPQESYLNQISANNLYNRELQTNQLADLVRQQRLLDYFQAQEANNRALQSYMSMQAGINPLSPSLSANQMLYSRFLSESAVLNQQLETSAPQNLSQLQLENLLSTERQISHARSIQLLQSRLNSSTMSGSSLASFLQSSPHAALPSMELRRLLQLSQTNDASQLPSLDPASQNASGHTHSLARSSIGEEKTREHQHLGPLKRKRSGESDDA